VLGLQQATRDRELAQPLQARNEREVECPLGDRRTHVEIEELRKPGERRGGLQLHVDQPEALELLQPRERGQIELRVVGDDREPPQPRKLCELLQPRGVLRVHVDHHQQLVPLRM
jgi:hypothetical protein